MRAHGTNRCTTGTVAGLVAALAGLAAVGCGGKGTEGTCPTYPGCGGDPKGDWTLGTGCQNLIVMPYQPPSLPDQLAQPQTPTQAPPQPQPTTSGDWCSQLVYQPSVDPTMPVRSVVLWHGPPTVHDGYLHVLADPGQTDRGTYTAQIQFRTTETTYFANACLTRYEQVAPSCDKLGMDLAAFEQTQPSFMFGTDMVCTGDSSVGCTCTYQYQVQGMEIGTWSLDASDATSIVFSSITRSEPQAAAFCQNGGTLQLSGKDGTNLFSAVGVRSAQYTRNAP
jgi:hypothetical protein